MANLASLYVSIGAKIEGFEQAMDQIDKQTRGLSGKLKNVGQSLSTYVTLPMAGLGAAAVKMASDANEAASKMEAVFGSATKEMNDWIKEARKTIPATTAELQAMTSGMQDLLVPMGVAPSKAKEMTKSVTKLAADLGAFNNMSPEEALQRLTSGLIGSYEPLLKFGVALNEATVSAEAYALGIAKHGEKLTAAQKAQAAYSLILKGTTAAHGQSAKEADGAAASFRFFWTEVKELGNTFGQQLLPAIVPVVKKLSELVKWLGSLNPVIIQTVAVLGGLAALAGPVLLVAGSIAQVVTAVAALAGPAALGALGTTLAVGGPILAGLVALGGMFVYAKMKAYEMSQQVEESIAKMQSSFASLSDHQLQNQLGFTKESVAALRKEVAELEKNGGRVQKLSGSGNHIIGREDGKRLKEARERLKELEIQMQALSREDERRFQLAVEYSKQQDEIARIAADQKKAIEEARKAAEGKKTLDEKVQARVQEYEALVKLYEMNLANREEAERMLALQKSLAKETGNRALSASTRTGVASSLDQTKTTAGVAGLDLSGALSRIPTIEAKISVPDFAPTVDKASMKLNKATGDWATRHHKNMTAMAKAAEKGVLDKGSLAYLANYAQSLKTVMEDERYSWSQRLAAAEKLADVESGAGKHKSLGERAAGFGKGLASAAGAGLGMLAGGAMKLLSALNPLQMMSTALSRSFDAFAPLMDKLAKPVAALSQALATAFAPVIDALVPIMERLTPIIAAVAQVFSILMQALMPLFEAAIPILEALFPIFKFLAIIGTYLGQALSFVAKVVFKIAQGISWAIGKAIWAIGKAIDAIPFVDGSDIIAAGDALVKVSDSMGNAANEMDKMYDNLGQARDKIAALELAEKLEETADAASKAGESLLNVPQGFKVMTQRYMAQAAIKAPTTTYEGGAGAKTGGAGAGTTHVDQSVVIEQVTITADSNTNGARVLDEMREEIRRQGLRGGVTELELV